MNSVLQADFFQSILLVSIIGKKVLTLRSKQVRIANGSTSSKGPSKKLGCIYSYLCISGIVDGWYSPELGWGSYPLFISTSLFEQLPSVGNNFSRISIRCCHTGAELRSKDPGASIFFSFRHNKARSCHRRFSCSFFFSDTIPASIRQPPDSEKQLLKPHIWL